MVLYKKAIYLLAFVWLQYSLAEVGICQTKVPSSWPEAPVLSKEIVGIEKVFQGFESGKSLPRGAELGYTNTDANVEGAGGLIVFAWNLIFGDERYAAIALHQASFDKSADSKLSSWDRNYWSRTVGGFHSPCLSSDGRRIAFRDGQSAPERGDSSSIIIWDVESRDFRAVTRSPDAKPFFYPVLKWSPGGRYLSYLRGGAATGIYDQWTKPYDLTVYDTKSHVEKTITSDVGLEWNWTSTGTLLYTQSSTNRGDAQWDAELRPTVYEIGLDGSAAKKILDHGDFAAAAPNNQWIAYCDWLGSRWRPGNAARLNLKREKKVERGLYLLHRATGKTIFIGSLALYRNPVIQWSPDSQSVFVLDGGELASETPTLYKLSQLDNLDFSAEKVDPKLFERVLTFPDEIDWFSYESKGISSDGRLLYLDRRARLNNDADSNRVTRHSLEVFETETRKRTTVATSDSSGEDMKWDFHESSSANPQQIAQREFEDQMPLWKPVPVKVAPAASVKKPTSRQVKKLANATKRKPARILKSKVRGKKKARGR